jgi:ferredoxin
MPQLRFRESACIQCGLCKSTCPENVISLVSRYDFTAAALNLNTIKEEEPFDCIKCGKPFASKSMIDTMTAKLEGHAMFSDKSALDRLKMCDNCRVVSLSTDETNPMFAGFRPVPRTTDDYIAGNYSDEEDDD